MIRLLTFSSLYPNSEKPAHGIFVENRLRHLLAAGGVESVVVAPVPYFPFKHPRFGEYSRFARVPKRESRFGIEVFHPSYPVIPRAGMTVAPFLMAAAAAATVKRIERTHGFDAIDAHYFYPDGVAAAMLARWLGKPLVITARGTDLNLIPKFPLPRKMIQWAARQSVHAITVCQALKDVLLDLGGDNRRVTVLRNGVDLEKFRPGPRDELRRELGLYRTTLLSVGWLIERKGHHIVIESLPRLPDVELAIVGSGPMEQQLRTLAKDLGVADRVRFVGEIDQGALVRWYGAADALVLASDREGMANVLLEALACGTPVIAVDCWGTPEVISSPVAGVLTKERSANGIVSAYQRLTSAWPSRQETRFFAEQFSWEVTSRGQFEIFTRAVSGAYAGAVDAHDKPVRP